MFIMSTDMNISCYCCSDICAVTCDCWWLLMSRWQWQWRSHLTW